MIFQKINIKKIFLMSVLLVLFAGFFTPILAQESLKEYMIPDSKYFYININESNRNYIIKGKTNQKKFIKNIEVFDNFKVEKTKDRFNFDLVEKDYKEDVDNLINKYNIFDSKFQKINKNNTVFIIYSLPVIEENKSKKYIISALIYNYRVIDELILFNKKINKEEMEDYLKLLLNISSRYNPLTEEVKQKIFEIKKNNYNYYLNNRDRIQIKYR